MSGIKISTEQCHQLALGTVTVSEVLRDFADLKQLSEAEFGVLCEGVRRGVDKETERFKTWLNTQPALLGQLRTDIENASVCFIDRQDSITNAVKFLEEKEEYRRSIELAKQLPPVAIKSHGVYIGTDSGSRYGPSAKQRKVALRKFEKTIQSLTRDLNSFLDQLAGPLERLAQYIRLHTEKGLKIPQSLLTTFEEIHAPLRERRTSGALVARKAQQAVGSSYRRLLIELKQYEDLFPALSDGVVAPIAERTFDSLALAELRSIESKRKISTPQAPPKAQQPSLGKKQESKGAESLEKAPTQSIAEEYRIIIEELSPYVPNQKERNRLAIALTSAGVKRAVVDLTAIVGASATTAILVAEPELFKLASNDLQKFLAYCRRLQDVAPAVKAFQEEGAFIAKDFVSIQAIERTIERAKQEHEEQQRLLRLCSDLERVGFVAEHALVVLRHGFFFDGRYYRAGKKLNRETVLANIRRDVTNYSQYASEINATLKRLEAQGAVDNHQGLSLNVRTGKDGPNNEVLVRAIQWVIDHPPREGRVTLSD